ncbi:hypothetical protein ACW9OX_004451, partial [Vibrio vulnificus]
VCGDFCGESGVRKLGLGGTHPLTQRYGSLFYIGDMMKRDMALIRKLLIDIEGHPNKISRISYDEHTQEEVNYHISLTV